MMLRGLANLTEALSLRELIVVYVDHNLRPQETPKEAAWVQSLAARLERPFQKITLDLTSSTPSLQATARKLRRQAFEQLLEERNGQAIATGHHADDQAETVLYRFLRGTGPKGLAGILPKQGCWIHPLLPFSRQELEGLAIQMKQDWLVDSSNLSTKYTRNQLRLELLPELEDVYNPQLRKCLASLAERMRHDEAFLVEELERRWKPPLLQVEQQEVRIQLHEWDKLPISLQRRALIRLLEKAHPTLSTLDGVVQELQRLVRRRNGESRIHLKDGWVAIRRYEELFLRSPVQNSNENWGSLVGPLKDFSLEIKGAGRYPTPHGVLVVERVDGTPRVSSLEEGFELMWEVYCEATEQGETEDLQGTSWVFRYRRPGDTIDFGTHHRPLKKWLIDEKIPSSLRWNMPLLVKNDRVYGVFPHLCLPPLQGKPSSKGWRLLFFSRLLHPLVGSLNGDSR